MNPSNPHSRRKFLRLAGGVGMAAVAGTHLASCSDSTAASPGVAAPTIPPPVPAPAGSKNVRTVRGLMDPKYLGLTDMHEHVLRDREFSDADTAAMFDEETLKELAELTNPEPVPKSFFPDEPKHPITLRNRYYLTQFYANAEKQYVLTKDLMLGELKDFAALGGQSILDCSPTYERGTPEVVRQMSEETGVNIILSTGINSHTMLPKRFKTMDVRQLAEYFESEISLGIEGTDIKAGNIKLLAEATEYGVPATTDQPLLRGLEAAAAVSRNTGAPVTLHAFNLKEEFKPLLTKIQGYGMPRDRMVLAHASTNLGPIDLKTLLREPQKLAPDLEPGFWAMDRGFILSFDLFGAGSAWIDHRRGFVPDYDPYAMAAVYQYVKAGYGDRIVFGTDVWMRIQTRAYGGPGIAHLLNQVVPQLLDGGLTQDELDQILIRTPARMLAF